MTIDALRTPDERFENLPGYDFEPNYIDDLEGFEGLRMHYIDYGSKDADVTFLCLHGEPTWAYLFRKMMPLFAKAGHRAVAPDYFGFGRSDKPTAEETYTFHFHRRSLMRFIERLDLKNVCLVVQDWGGLLGLTLPVEYPDRINRLILMNTAIATGESAGPGFDAWRDYVANKPSFSISGLMKRSVADITDEETLAYEAPYPDMSYRAGVTRFPALVMTEPGMEGVEESVRAAKFLKHDWAGDSFMAVGMKDPVLGPPVMSRLRKAIKGCPEPMNVEEAGHFVQEHGAQVATRALAHFGL